MVSIHAPTRGATYQGVCLAAAKSVSIHAPTRGATRGIKRSGTRKSSFNPRTHTGCDLRKKLQTASVEVSIHAPTRGATGYRVYAKPVKRVSIHAPTRGATAGDLEDFELNYVSIHAPTRGATWYIQIGRIGSPSFNPRTHTGCDTAYALRYLPISSFNPRTHTGCDTCRVRDIDFVISVSIHAPTRGATYA